MKKLLFFLLLVSCIKSVAQNRQDSCVIGSIYRGDTLFSFNPCTGEIRQITKVVLPYTGEGVKMYLSVGSTRYWAPIDSMMWVYFTPSNYLAIADSASMLSKYLRKTDTSAMFTNYAKRSELNAYVPLTRTINGSPLSNNITLTKSDFNLGNVDNTSDLNKPISTATQSALDGKSATGHTHTISNITGYTGYTLQVQALTSSPTDAKTIYFGMLPKAPVTAAATSKIYIRKAGTLKIAEIYCYSGTAGTNEAWVLNIRLNNTTDTQIASVSASTNERVFSNTNLSIAVNVGDYIEIKSVNPTWATNPLTTIFGGYIYIE